MATMNNTDTEVDTQNRRQGRTVAEARREAAREGATTSWLTALRFTVLMALALGLVYPLIAVGLSQVWFPHQASGSLIADDQGRVVGSTLVGQQFGNDRYFQGRPSAVDYAADGVGGSNLAPSNPELRERAEADAARISARDGVALGQIPADLLSASGSGIDPHISPAAAEIQIERVARVRSMDPQAVRALVERYRDSGGLVGEPVVNVLKLNLALDGIATHPVL